MSLDVNIESLLSEAWDAWEAWEGRCRIPGRRVCGAFKVRLERVWSAFEVRIDW